MKQHMIRPILLFLLTTTPLYCFHSPPRDMEKNRNFYNDNEVYNSKDALDTPQNISDEMSQIENSSGNFRRRPSRRDSQVSQDSYDINEDRVVSRKESAYSRRPQPAGRRSFRSRSRETRRPLPEEETRESEFEDGAEETTREDETEVEAEPVEDSFDERGEEDFEANETQMTGEESDLDDSRDIDEEDSSSIVEEAKPQSRGKGHNQKEKRHHMKEMRHNQKEMRHNQKEKRHHKKEKNENSEEDAPLTNEKASKARRNRERRGNERVERDLKQHRNKQSNEQSAHFRSKRMAGVENTIAENEDDQTEDGEIEDDQTEDGEIEDGEIEDYQNEDGEDIEDDQNEDGEIEDAEEIEDGEEIEEEQEEQEEQDDEDEEDSLIKLDQISALVRTKDSDGEEEENENDSDPLSFRDEEMILELNNASPLNGADDKEESPDSASATADYYSSSSAYLAFFFILLIVIFMPALAVTGYKKHYSSPPLTMVNVPISITFSDPNCESMSGRVVHPNPMDHPHQIWLHSIPLHHQGQGPTPPPYGGSGEDVPMSQEDLI